MMKNFSQQLFNDESSFSESPPFCNVSIESQQGIKEETYCEAGDCANCAWDKNGANLQFDKGLAQEPRWRVASTTDYKSRVTQEVNRELETGYSN
jgi:hypothetical protein